jgi:hypothetical protein
MPVPCHLYTPTALLPKINSDGPVRWKPQRVPELGRRFKEKNFCAFRCSDFAVLALKLITTRTYPGSQEIYKTVRKKEKQEFSSKADCLSKGQRNFLRVL